MQSFNNSAGENKQKIPPKPIGGFLVNRKLSKKEF